MARTYDKGSLTTLSDEELSELMYEWKLARWNASQSRNASGVFRATRALDSLYREKKRRRRS